MLQFCTASFIYGGKNKIKAIIYTSNTGSTAEYAELLGKGLAAKTDRTPEGDDMLDMMVNDGKRVSLQN